MDVDCKDDDDEEEIPELVSESRLKTEKIPVTILCGFLGSGKTTLLNHLLTQNHGKRIAIIENEFSQGLGIESMIIQNGLIKNQLSKSINQQNSKDETNLLSFFELNNGCICCTVKDSLLITLEQLILHKSKFDTILIETTGMANPGPIISMFWNDSGIDCSLRLDGVVCVVDSVNFLSYIYPSTIHTSNNNKNDNNNKINNITTTITAIDGNSNSIVSSSYSNRANEDYKIADDVKMQVSYADRILLNKSDLVITEKMSEIEQEVRNLNGLAQIRHTSYSTIDPSWVLDINGYNTSTTFSTSFSSSSSSMGTSISSSSSSQQQLFMDSINNLIYCQPTSSFSTSSTNHKRVKSIVNNNSSISSNSNSNGNSSSNNTIRNHTQELGTVSYTVKGRFDLGLLNRFLDSILYANGTLYVGLNNNNDDDNDDNSSMKTMVVANSSDATLTSNNNSISDNCGSSSNNTSSSSSSSNSSSNNSSSNSSSSSSASSSSGSNSSSSSSSSSNSSSSSSSATATDRIDTISTNMNSSSSSSSILELKTSPQPHVTHPTDMRIYRMKGSVCVQHSDTLYLLQAVHDIFELVPSAFSTATSSNDYDDKSSNDLMVLKNSSNNSSGSNDSNSNDSSSNTSSSNNNVNNERNTLTDEKEVNDDDDDDDDCISKFIVIGKNINRQFIYDGLLTCLASNHS